VEVLKGPQGTLFGSNATGGAINFVAAKPTSTLKAGFDLGYGRFNTVEASGFISGPLSDTLSVRLAVKAVRGDEWQQSYTRDDRLGKTNTSAARLIIDWRPTDRLKLQLNVNGWRDKSDPEAPQIARAPTPADLSAPIGTVSFLTGRSVTAQLPILNYPAAPHTPRAADWSPQYRPFQDTRMFQTTLNASYDLTDDIALTSLTNYIDYRHNKAQNLSGSALLDVDNSGDRANATTFSQEVRIANSGAGDSFRWVLGANYERTKSYQIIDLLYPDASTGVQQGFSANSFDTRQNVRNLAGFGHVEYDVFDKLTLKAGVRYTDSRHSAVSGTYVLNGYVEPYATDPGFLNFVNLVFGSVYTPLLCPGATFVPVQPGGSISINPKTCQSGIFQEVLQEHNTSWSAGIDYKPVHGLLLYANVSKGFKAGAFPISSASSWAQYEPVKQESVIDYEIGFKSTLAGGHALVNGSVFYYDYRNKQLRGKIVDPLFDAIDNLVNVPRSSIKGAELEITVQPARGFTVRVAGTYLDTEIKDFVGIVGSTNIGPNGQPTAFKFPVFAQFRGVTLPFAPKWQLAASADYSFSITDRLDAFLGGNLSAQTESYGSPQLSVQGRADARIDGYAALDLRAGFGSSDDHWKVTFWGKNVTNTYYWTNALRNYDTVVRYAGRPAEYGVSVAWRY
jgi:outer membrane receptor protein involved in Fe transport